MYICNEDREKLTVKHPEKLDNMYRAISKYMTDLGYNERDLHSAGRAYKDFELSDQSYAHHIEIYSSGNEEKIYVYVHDEHDRVLYYTCLLDTSPEAYGKATAYAGLFLETFNKYITYNFIFK